MIDVRKFSDLGTFQNDWLDANYHFSFGDYRDSARLGHGKLRVWNDDTIKPDTGFAPHGHRDMEIITYVRTGAITHTDSMGNKGRTEAGDVQVMSAGSGVRHSEWNAEDDATTLFQIWIEPAHKGGEPGWDARKFPKSDHSGEWTILASGAPEGDTLEINQDALVLGATLKAGDTLDYELLSERFGYLVLAAGSVDLNGTVLNARDGVAIMGAEALKLTGVEDAEIVFVDTI